MIVIMVIIIWSYTVLRYSMYVCVMMSIAPCGPPGQPVVDSVSPNAIALHWDKPRDTGNGKIQGYIVEMKPTAGGDWKEVNLDPVREPEMVVPHLKEGQEYQFRVKAVNEAGPGAPSAATGPVVAEKPAGSMRHVFTSAVQG